MKHILLLQIRSCQFCLGEKIGTTFGSSTTTGDKIYTACASSCSVKSMIIAEEVHKAYLIKRS